MTTGQRRTSKDGSAAAGNRGMSRSNAAPSASQDPAGILDFLWRVSKDEQSQDGLCRLMWNGALAAAVLSWPAALFVFFTMPGRAVEKLAVTLGSTLTIATGASLRHRTKKRRRAATGSPAGDEIGPSGGNGSAKL